MPASAIARHLIVPFAGRGTPGCRAAVAGLRLPKLEALLARLTPVHEDIGDEATLSPPHERALAEALGIASADGCIPWAAMEARAAGLPATEAGQPWGTATLCHWQVGIDDVMLGDPGDIRIDAAESAALLAAARPFFEEDGIALHESATPGRWVVQGAIFDQLPTASIDRAVGYPISQWSPLSEAGRPLRRLQNEMQMLLYTERVNDERTARGVPPINSFWLSGTGSLPVAFVPSAAPPVVADALRSPALRDDGAAWASAWQALDAGPVAELLAAATRGETVALTLCGDRVARRYELRPRGFAGWARSLFRRPALAPVLESL
ncbi:hypothetical protein QTH87_08710 [Variovorax sp. J22P168]|uniref:hypothetical protein n=1 Tax=Variovorax jilinensis TaxID=3053513 RepID=UPI00257517CC|nr:hypothetical protein [Variovorax sp. J22P168]MDM0012512.1 hypothetical protein [Variovorax sp. J22P168]